MVDLSFNPSELNEVDIHMSLYGISIVGDWYGENPSQRQIDHPSLENAF
jgi:hypothetical protein